MGTKSRLFLPLRYQTSDWYKAHDIIFHKDHHANVGQVEFVGGFVDFDVFNQYESDYAVTVGVSSVAKVTSQPFFWIKGMCVYFGGTEML